MLFFEFGNLIDAAFVTDDLPELKAIWPLGGAFIVRRFYQISRLFHHAADELIRAINVMLQIDWHLIDVFAEPPFEALEAR
jgi:hypothetical protein